MYPVTVYCSLSSFVALTRLYFLMDPREQIHALLVLIAANVYSRASSFELKRTGKTYSTDSSDVSPEEWLLGKKFRRWRVLSWWTLAILLVMALLVPLELLLEAGIGESNRCRPKTITNPSGVCASPVNPRASDPEIYSQMSLIQNIRWQDKQWNAVPVGASKQPKAEEVRALDKMRSNNRSFVAKECKVIVEECPGSSCGAVKVTKDGGGMFKTIVKNWTHRPIRAGSNWERGDLTFDTKVATVFIFKEYGAAAVPIRRGTNPNRTEIRVIGVEMILGEREKSRPGFLSPKEPYSLAISGSESRKYLISCQTDGLLARDMARAVSLYRTGLLEKPGVFRDEVQGRIANLKPLDATDVAKSLLALTSERWAKTCQGDVEVYRTCGTVNPWFVLPFAILASIISAVWVLVRFSTFRQITEDVPHNAHGWRERALALAREMNLHKQNCPDSPPPSGLESSMDSSMMEPYVSGTLPTTKSYASH